MLRPTVVVVSWTKKLPSACELWWSGKKVIAFCAEQQQPKCLDIWDHHHHHRIKKKYNGIKQSTHNLAGVKWSEREKRTSLHFFFKGHKKVWVLPLFLTCSISFLLIIIIFGKRRQKVTVCLVTVRCVTPPHHVYLWKWQLFLFFFIFCSHWWDSSSKHIFLKQRKIDDQLTDCAVLSAINCDVCDN